MASAVNLSCSVGNPASAALLHSAADGRLSIVRSSWAPTALSLHHTYRSKKVICLRRAPFRLDTRRMMPKITRNSGSSSSGSNVDETESLDKKKVPFGYTRKDVLLIGVGVTLLGVGLKTGLELVGVDPLQAGNAVQLVIVLGLTVGWISTYMFRVANKDMTYAQQLKDYEKKVMEKRLEGLTEAELVALLEQVEEEKRHQKSGEQVN